MIAWSLSKKIFFNIAETTIIIMVFSFLFVVSSVSAANEQYPVDEQVVIGEFIYDDDYVATTTDCFIDIWAPYLDENDELVSIVTNIKMSTSTTGWHYYNFVGSSTPGIWPATIKCGTTGVDLIKGDKTFVLTTTTVVTDVATAVWANTERTLTDYATSSIAERVWNYPGRALDNFTTLVQAVWGNLIGDRKLTAFGSLAADVWNNAFAPDRMLTSKQLTGAGGGELATESYIDTATSTLDIKIENASSSLAVLINAGASQADIETASTSLAVLINTRASQESLDNASTTIGGRFDLITTSTIATAVWGAPSRSLNNFTDLVSAVWGNIAGDRKLTAFGSLAADVWNNAFAPDRMLTSKQLTGAGGGNLATESYVNMATSSLSTTLETASSSLASLINTRASLSNQEAGWTVNLSDFGATVPEEAYQARLQILNYKTEPTAPDSAPTWVIYDAAGTPQADGAMTTDSTGTYSYSITVPTAGVSGVWETVVTVVVGGKTLRVNDYWEVQSSPAHVSVDYMIDDEISDTDSNVSAFVTIINEGFSWYEYHYEYCVVTSNTNACGGDDDVFHGTGSTKIDSKKTYNTTLLANNITAVGTYYFKLIVYYGTDRSGASISFPVTMSSGVISCGDGSCNGTETCSSCSADCGRCSGGGGGGGGSTPPPTPPLPPVVPQMCDGADFNHDKKVNSIDFSILLAFWKTSSPFRNICVDINTDSKVDSVDFSILMYQWGIKK